MLKQLFTFFFILFTVAVQAQTNLVPNGSFEIADTCPDNSGQISRALYWSAPTNGSPDYFNSCASISSTVSVPLSSYFGFQNAKDGNAYAGLYTLYDVPKRDAASGDTSYREYIKVQLTEQLDTCHFYNISLWVNLPDSMRFASTPIQILFTEYDVDSFATYNYLNLTPQISFNTVITDKINWVELTTNYKPNKNYRFMLIGNFNKNFNMTITNVTLVTDSFATDFNSSYYFIDNIVINKEDISTKPIPNIITPNDDSINDRINFSNFNAFQSGFIYNRWGVEILNLKEVNFIWDGKNCVDGTYYYILNTIGCENKTYKGFIEIIR